MRTFLSTIWVSFLLCLSVISLSAQQQENPVRWSFWSQDIGDNTFIITFKADIDEGWYVYSHYYESEVGVPTKFVFNGDDNFTHLDGVREMGDLIEEEDPFLGETVKKYAQTVSFQMTLKSLEPKVYVTGDVHFMTCDDSKCLPPASYPFRFNLESTMRPAEFNFISVDAGQSDFDVVPSKVYADKDPIVTNGGNIYMQEPEVIISADGSMRLSNSDLLSSKEPAYDTNEERTKTVEKELFTASSVANMFSKPKAKAEAKAKKKKALLAKAEIPAKPNKEQEAKKAEQTAVQKRIAKNINPITWTNSMRPIDASKGIYELVLEAKPIEGWSLYGSSAKKGNAPAPTAIAFSNVEGITFIGGMKELATEKEQLDPIFKKKVAVYDGSATYVQKVKFDDNVVAHADITFMASNGEQFTLPRAQSFSFNQDLSALDEATNNAQLWWIAITFVAAIVLFSLFRLVRRATRKEEELA